MKWVDEDKFLPILVVSFPKIDVLFENDEAFLFSLLSEYFLPNGYMKRLYVIFLSFLHIT